MVDVRHPEEAFTALCTAVIQRYRCMTWRPTQPNVECSKASGTVPMMLNPSACHSRTAASFDSATALNCIAAYPAHEPMRAHTRPERARSPASAATMKLAVETCEPGPGRLGPMCAVPSTRPPSQATTVRPGGDTTHTSRACSDDHAGS